MPDDIRTNKAFQSDIAEVSFSHLLELAIALGAYRDGLILVGGWVPYLLLQKHQPKRLDFRHAGSIDVDFAVNPKRVEALTCSYSTYSKICINEKF